jgi:hypothetical protein
MSSRDGGESFNGGSGVGFFFEGFFAVFTLKRFPPMGARILESNVRGSYK